MSGVIANLFVRVLPDTTGFRGSLTKTAEAEGTASGGIFKKAFSKGFAGIAGAVGFGAIIGGALEAASKYETATATLAAQAGISMQAAKAIGDAFLTTGGKSVFTAQEIVAAYAPVSPLFTQVAGHVLSASQALAVMTVAQHLAEASGKPLVDTTQSLALVMRTFGSSVGDAGKIGDILYNAGKAGGIGIDELVTAMDKMKGKLGVLAPSIQDTATVIGILAAHGIQGTKGLLAFNTGLVSLESGGKKVTTTIHGLTTKIDAHGKAHTVAAKAVHITTLETAELGVKLTDASGNFLGMSSIIGQLQPKLAKLSEAQRLQTEQALFGKAAAGAWDDILKGGLPTWDAVSKKIGETGTASEAAEKKSSTFHGTMEKLKAAVADASVRLGEKFLPVVEKVANGFLKALPFITAFADILQSVVFNTIGATFRGIGNAFQWVLDKGGPLKGAILGIAGALGLYVVAITAVKIATAAWAVVQAILDAAFSVTIVGIGLLVLAAAGIGAVVWVIISNWSHITGFFTDIKRAVLGAVLTMATSIVGFFTDAWNKVSGFFKTWGPLALIVLAPFIGVPLYIWQHWNSVLEMLKTAWHVLTSSFWTDWNWLYQNVILKFTNAWTTVQNGVTGSLNAIKNAFTDAVRFIGSTWTGLENVLKVPVNWIIQHIYNDGISAMWNWVASKVGLPQLPKMALLAGGGVLPGYAPGQDKIMAMLSPGEGVLVPEAVRAMGPGAVDAINAKYGHGRKSTATAYAGGGVVGDIINFIGGTVKVLSNPAAAITGALGGNSFVAMLAQLPGKLLDSIGPFLTNKVPGLIASGALSLLGKAGSAISNFFGGLFGGGGGGGAPTGPAFIAGAGVARWAAVIDQALALLGQPLSWLSTVERRMNQESGGNPAAVNRTDINWQHGTPSVGLMQVIGPTFRAWAGQFLNTGPFLYGTSIDPLANIYSGLNYAMHRYGSLAALNQPGGYDSGGWLMPPLNGTRKPEAVLNPEESAGLIAFARGGGKVSLDSMTISKLAQAINARPNKINISSPDWSILPPGVPQ